MDAYPILGDSVMGELQADPEAETLGGTIVPVEEEGVSAESYLGLGIITYWSVSRSSERNDISLGRLLGRLRELTMA